MLTVSTPAPFQLNKPLPPISPPPLHSSNISKRNYIELTPTPKIKFPTPPPSQVLYKLHKNVLDLKSKFHDTQSAMLRDILAINTRLTKSEDMNKKEIKRLAKNQVKS